MGQSCGDDEGGGDLSVGFESMSGLFLILGCTGAAAFLLAAWQRQQARSRVEPEGEGGGAVSHTMTEGEMLREVLHKVRLMSSPAMMAALDEAALKLQKHVRGRAVRNSVAGRTRSAIPSVVEGTPVQKSPGKAHR